MLMYIIDVYVNNKCVSMQYWTYQEYNEFRAAQRKGEVGNVDIKLIGTTTSACTMFGAFPMQ